MRRFHLYRHTDISGNTGEHCVVAVGVMYRDGVTHMVWRPGLAGVSKEDRYGSLADLEKLSGHGGKTVVVWVDQTHEPWEVEPENDC